MKNLQKGFVAPVFLVVIAILIIGGGLYIYEDKKANNTGSTEVKQYNQIPETTKQDSVIAPSQNSQKTPISNWKTYVNSDLGYSISYPPTYHEAYGNDLFNFDEDKFEKGNSSGVKIQIQKISEKFNASKADVPTIKFSEKVTNGPGGSFDIYSVTNLNGTKIFNILVWGIENDKQNVLNILSTFKFAPITPKTTIDTKPTITVLSPNGGEKWDNVSAKTISWKTNIASNESVTIYAIQNLSGCFNLKPSYGCLPVIDPENVIASNIANSGKYQWIPNVTGNYYIRICKGSEKTICDTSDTVFTVVDSTLIKPSINVLSPNGGETWKIGTQQTIRWSLAGNIPSGYKIGIFLDGGFITQLNASSTNVYSFTVPSTIFHGDVGTTLIPGKYKINISLYDGDINLGNGNPNYNWGKVVTQDSSDNEINVTN